MHTLGHGLLRKNWKLRKMRITLVRYWYMTRIIEKHEKWKMHSVERGICEKTKNHGK